MIVKHVFIMGAIEILSQYIFEKSINQSVSSEVEIVHTWSEYENGWRSFGLNQN